MSDTTADVFEEDAVQPGKEVEVVGELVEAPADFTALDEEQKATVGYSIEKQILEDSHQVMARYLRIGRNLYLVQKHGLYVQLGYGTFDEWRAQPEMCLARATSYALMKVYEVFIEKLKVDAVGLESLDWTKLYTVSPFVDETNVDDFIEKVKTLSRADLQREVAIMRAKRAGKTDADAQAQVAAIDLVRESCPIGCGGKCGLIDANQDNAVEEFKKSIGKWKGLHGRIRAFFGIQQKQKRKPADEPAKEDAPPTEAPVPTKTDVAPPAVRSEPHVPACGPQEQVLEPEICGGGPDEGRTDVEGGGEPEGGKPNGPCWPV